MTRGDPQTMARPALQPRSDLPGPLLRRGPRPLLLHLMLAWMRSNGSAAASLNWSSGSPLSKTALDPWSAVRGRDQSTPGPEPGQDVLQLLQQDQAMISGIASYRRHPAKRTLSAPPALWSEGEARLLDYAPHGAGPPVLFVPSLINRGYILDLSARNSLCRFLARNGLRPLLLDWGWPGPAERRYTLTDYIVGPLERAIEAVGQPVILAGYCMGGLLATAVAQRRPDRVRALAVLATPWDFRAQDPEQADRLARIVTLLQPVLDANNTVPIDVLQSLFAMLDPTAVADKFRRFGKLEQNGARARLFVAIEDWANDGVPLAAPVARECFADWYGRNTPMTGEWRVAGMVVDPPCRAETASCRAKAPGRWRICSPASAQSSRWPVTSAW
jgi:polyhydroxyalkanoate synthase